MLLKIYVYLNLYCKKNKQEMLRPGEDLRDHSDQCSHFAYQRKVWAQATSSLVAESRLIFNLFLIQSFILPLLLAFRQQKGYDLINLELTNAILCPRIH